MTAASWFAWKLKESIGGRKAEQDLLCGVVEFGFRNVCASSLAVEGHDGTSPPGMAAHREEPADRQEEPAEVVGGEAYEEAGKEADEEAGAVGKPPRKKKMPNADEETIASWVRMREQGMRYADIAKMSGGYVMSGVRKAILRALADRPF